MQGGIENPIFCLGLRIELRINNTTITCQEDNLFAISACFHGKKTDDRVSSVHKSLNQGFSVLGKKVVLKNASLKKVNINTFLIINIASSP